MYKAAEAKLCAFQKAKADGVCFLVEVETVDGKLVSICGSKTKCLIVDKCQRLIQMLACDVGNLT